METSGGEKLLWSELMEAFEKVDSAYSRKLFMGCDESEVLA